MFPILGIISYLCRKMSAMSKFLFYMKVKPFIRQWLTYHFGNPVVFPAKSAENACIRHFVGLRPKNAKPIKPEPDDNMIAIVIPESKRKKTICWNYMSQSACDALNEVIDDTFRLQLWTDLNAMTQCHCSILTSVRAWCENNGISTDYDYTLKMRYQRMRNSYLKYGIDLRKK